jgi:hypothetical protein
MLGALIGLITVLLNAGQLFLARQQQVTASEARNTAQTAANDAIEAKLQAMSAEKGALEALKKTAATQCEIVLVGWELYRIGNEMFYPIARVTVMASKDRDFIFDKMIELRERLLREHKKAGCPPVAEISQPPKVFR